MTVDSQEISVATLLGFAKAILLDFDGPVCSIFAGTRASDVADALAQLLHRLTGKTTAVPSNERDPLNILRRAGQYGSAITRPIADALTAAEIGAVHSATPTAGAGAFLGACHATGLPVAIVSNNSSAAVVTYLKKHGLDQNAALVVGRTSDNPALMKPNPHLVHLALARLSAYPTTALLIGDSATDVEAARTAGVPALGYANKPGKAASLRTAGASGLIESMFEAATCVGQQTARSRLDHSESLKENP
jgi:HAD superfamily hydrolase (TIGR01509 family)